MQLVTYRAESGWRSGVLVEDHVVDTFAAALCAGVEGGEPQASRWLSTRTVLAQEGDALARIHEAAQRLAAMDSPLAVVSPVDSLALGPPVPDAEKIICLGLNYRDHIAETQSRQEVAPVLFGKFRNSLIGHGAAVVMPHASEAIDYEGELAVVIGRRCKDVTAADAFSYVAGYMPANDITARDLQTQTHQWTAGKAIDTFAPCGPALVMREAAGDVENLRLSTRVNGATVQSASTADMVVTIPAAIAFISAVMTLEPGDILLTGTPAGVGAARNPPSYLRPGDTVEVEIEGLGTLRNPIVAGVKEEGAAR